MRLPLLLFWSALLMAPLAHTQDGVPATLDSVLVGEDGTTEEEQPAFTYEEWKQVSDDTIAVDRRGFDDGAVQGLKVDPELDYDRTAEVQLLWWDRLMRWIGRRLEDLFGSRGGRLVFDNLEWIILGIVVVFLLYYFRRRLFHGTFARSAQRARQVTEVEGDIERLDLDKLLAAAEKERNWRLALRYHYLKVLRRLVDGGRIQWEPRYTDLDYLRQLKEPALRATFSDLSFLFKWVWYGDAPMDQARYQQLKPQFEAFHQRALTSSTPAPGPAVASA